MAAQLEVKKFVAESESLQDTVDRLMEELAKAHDEAAQENEIAQKKKGKIEELKGKSSRLQQQLDQSGNATSVMQRGLVAQQATKMHDDEKLGLLGVCRQESSDAQKAQNELKMQLQKAVQVAESEVKAREEMESTLGDKGVELFAKKLELKDAEMTMEDLQSIKHELGLMVEESLEANKALRATLEEELATAQLELRGVTGQNIEVRETMSELQLELNQEKSETAQVGEKVQKK